VRHRDGLDPHEVFRKHAPKRFVHVPPRARAALTPIPDASRVVSKICARARCEPMTMRPSGAEWIPRPFPRFARSIRAILASNAFDGRPRAVSLSRALTHARHCRSTRARERRSTRERRSIVPAGRSPSLVFATKISKRASARDAEGRDREVCV
jgi:hypothetical protein